MKKIMLIGILTFYCVVNPAFSQNKTPYQKKVDIIMTEMCEAIGVKNSLIQIAKKTNNWNLVRNSQDFAFKCKLLEQEELLAIIISTDKKLKDAEKFKNREDFNRERVKEKELTLQKELELRKRLMRFSDISKIKSKIKSSFTEWIIKDEFETSNDYQNRITEKEKVLDSIAIEIIQNWIVKLIPDKCSNRDDSPYYLELIKYDADKQLYNVELVCRAYTGIPQYGQHQSGLTDRITDTLNVSVEVAKFIKQKSTKDRYKIDSDADIIWFCNKEVITSKKLTDWIISPNGYFLPKKFNLFNQYEHLNENKFTQLNKIHIKTSELELKDYFDYEYVIDIDKIWKKRQL